MEMVMTFQLVDRPLPVLICMNLFLFKILENDQQKRTRQARDLSPPWWGERGRYYILDMTHALLPLEADDFILYIVQYMCIICIWMGIDTVIAQTRSELIAVSSILIEVK